MVLDQLQKRAHQSDQKAPFCAPAAGELDQPWTNRPRGEVIARMAADLAALAQTGDLDGARVLHEAIERLLRG